MLEYIHDFYMDLQDEQYEESQELLREYMQEVQDGELYTLRTCNK